MWWGVGEGHDATAAMLASGFCVRSVSGSDTLSGLVLREVMRDIRPVDAFQVVAHARALPLCGGALVTGVSLPRPALPSVSLARTSSQGAARRADDTNEKQLHTHI